MPELVASGIAAYKREPDLALGNLIGSNIFNVFLAAGISASIIPLPVDAQGIKMKVDTRANQKKVPSKLLLEKKTGSVVAADV